MRLRATSFAVPSLPSMKGLSNLVGAIALGCFAVESAARAVGYSPKEWIKPYKREVLQDIVSVSIGNARCS